MLIKQRTFADCSVACLAMLLEITWEQASTFVSQYEWTQGGTWSKHMISNVNHWKGDDKFLVEIHESQSQFKDIDWEKPLILTLPSLNLNNKIHHVFWNGENLLDPSTRKTYPIDYDPHNSENKWIITKSIWLKNTQ